MQFRRIRDEDRFYIPVKARKSHQNHKRYQEREEARLVNRTDLTDKSDSKIKSLVVDRSRSNLERLFEATTPSVPAQYFSKTTRRGWRTCDVEYQPYFTLGDLWESFKEWSVYGAGVPLILDGSNSVVQYYVPYLSGIQLYGPATASFTPRSRQAIEDSDSDCYKDTSSDGSSDYEFKKGMKSNLRFRIGNLSLIHEHSSTLEGSSSDDEKLEILEISDLASQYPGLNTIRSCDLLPVSWISVAWYPIYRIPTGPTLKDLDAFFLTYHLLSTPIGGGGNTPAPVVVYPRNIDGVPRISLPVFGMASYKFKGSMWTQNGVTELQLANSLMQAADNWLRLLEVYQHDFQFFASHGMYQRKINSEKKTQKEGHSCVLRIVVDCPWNRGSTIEILRMGKENEASDRMM